MPSGVYWRFLKLIWKNNDFLFFGWGGPIGPPRRFFRHFPPKPCEIEESELKSWDWSLSACQSASKFDPVSASNFDPLWRRVLAVALAPSELVGVAETARARVGV